MPSLIARIAGSALAAAFAWATLAKVVNFSQWTSALRGYRLDRRLEGPAIGLVPLSEALIVGLLVFVNAKIGAALSVAMLAAFSLALLHARSVRGDRLPCGCFGKSHDRDYRVMLMRNGLLAALSAAVLVSDLDFGVVRGLDLPDAGQLIPAALVALGAAAVWWTLRHTLFSWRRGPT